jgi:heme exporter protein CcmD
LNGILAVDGYTGYLVIAYGVTALVVVGNLVAARRQFRQSTGGCANS